MLVKNNFFLRHAKLLWILLGVVIVVAVLFGIFGFSRNKKVTFAQMNNNIAIVQKGDISVSISGSGTIESASAKNIASEVSAKVKSVNVSVGDKVSKGDVLFELDSSDLETQIRNKQRSVTNLSKTVSSYKEDVENLNVYTTSAGYISNLKYSKGDTVSKNAVLFEIADASNYKVEIKVYYNANNPVNIGDTVKLMFSETFTYIDGVVTNVSDIKEQSTLGGQLQTVEIEVENPGYTLEGVEVSNISIKTIQGLTVTSATTGTVVANEPKSFKSPSSGTIKEIYISNGSYVSDNQLVIVLENDDLYDDLSDAKLSLSDAVTELNDIKSDSSFYTITSPIDGIVTSVNISEGDYVRSESTIAKVVNNYEIEFEINVDELDILDLAVGQKAKVTIDAIEETAVTPLEGTVSEIALEGTTMSSVTSYPVTISLTGNDDIKMGMNCSAEIIVESAEDVLMVPVEAITSRKGKYYVTLENNETKEVEVGIYNEDYIEIVSGLNEGDKVILPTTVSGNSKNTEKQGTNQMGGFSGGGMPNMGGMSNGGGMPGGMNMGGGR